MFKIKRVETMFGNRYWVSESDIHFKDIINPPEKVIVKFATSGGAVEEAEIPLPDVIWVEPTRNSLSPDFVLALQQSEVFKDGSRDSRNLHAAVSKVENFNVDIKYAHKNYVKALASKIAESIAKAVVEEDIKSKEIEVTLDNGLTGRLSVSSIEVSYKGLTYTSTAESNTPAVALALSDFDKETAEKEKLMLKETRDGKTVFENEDTLLRLYIVNANALTSAIGLLIVDDLSKAKRHLKMVIKDIIPVTDGEVFKKEKFEKMLRSVGMPQEEAHVSDAINQEERDTNEQQ